MADGGGPVDIGTGTTLTLVTSAFTSQLTDLQWSGMARESVETTHMGTTGGTNANRTFMPVDLADAGELTCTFHFDPDEAPELQTAEETVRVEWPLYAAGETRAKWEATGFMTSFEINDPLEDKMTATATWKLDGDITVTGSIAA